MKDRKRNRLQGYDYSRDNLYFVTNCVKGMVCCFGNVVGTGRDLSKPDAGTIRDLSKPDAGNGRNLSKPDAGTSRDLSKPDAGIGRDLSKPDAGTIRNLSNTDAGTGRNLSNPDAGTGRNLSNPDVGTGRNLSNPDAGTGRDLSLPNKTMILNTFGKIVQDRLLWLPIQYPYVVLHNSVVMPNHIHAILEIDSSRVKGTSIKIKSLSSLFGAFKTTSSKMIHQAGFMEFSWHRSFHDHIIRNDKSYRNISNYIDQNPSKWDSDKFFTP